MMNNRAYIVGALTVILLIWGPLDHSWPAWLLIRTGYLIILPVGTWWLLKWIWRMWMPDTNTEERLSRTLTGITSGALLILAVMAAMRDSHAEYTDVIRTRDGFEGVGDLVHVPGPDWGGAFVFVILSLLFFWASVRKHGDE